MPNDLSAVSPEVSIYILESWTVGIIDLAVMTTAEHDQRESAVLYIYLSIYFSISLGIKKAGRRLSRAAARVGRFRASEKSIYMISVRLAAIVETKRRGSLLGRDYLQLIIYNAKNKWYYLIGR